MMDKTFKGKIAAVLAAIALFTLFTGMVSLFTEFFNAKNLEQIAPGTMQVHEAMAFFKWVDFALAFIVAVTLLFVIYAAFSKSKKFKIAAVSMLGVLILTLIVVMFRTKSLYMDEEKVDKNVFTIVLAYQSNLIQVLLGSVVLELVCFYDLFRKKLDKVFGENSIENKIGSIDEIAEVEDTDEIAEVEDTDEIAEVEEVAQVEETLLNKKVLNNTKKITEVASNESK